MAFAPPPTPRSALGYYRLLSPTASVRVSPLCLGAMNFGKSWSEWMGECTQETAFAMLDFFYENGGNFIDTANGYHRGESEQWLGEWMANRGNRDQMVIATKYTTPGMIGKPGIIVNSGGNGSKSLRLALEQSLKNLQSSYIDVLYVHWWDYTCSIPELMHSLNDVVSSGKVLYLGISDAPAWVVSKANQYARDHGLRQFVVYQGNWSAACRDFERDIIPMCESEGMGLAPWGALGGGKFKSEEQIAATDGRKWGEASEQDKLISKVLETVAKRHDSIITSVALAYILSKAPYVFPIVGGRTMKHLEGNIKALSLELTKEDVAEIEAAVPFDIGFPVKMIGQGGPGFMNAIGGPIDFVEPAKAIPVHKA